jgi:hypothetical protein
VTCWARTVILTFSVDRIALEKDGTSAAVIKALSTPRPVGTELYTARLWDGYGSTRCPIPQTRCVVTGGRDYPTPVERSI